MLLLMRKTLKRLIIEVGDGLKRWVSLYGSLAMEGLTGTAIRSIFFLISCFSSRSS